MPFIIPAQHCFMPKLVGYRECPPTSSPGHFGLKLSGYHIEWYPEWKPDCETWIGKKLRPGWGLTHYLGQGLICEGASKLGLIWTLEYRSFAFQHVHFVNPKIIYKRDLSLPHSSSLFIHFCILCWLLGVVLEMLVLRELVLLIFSLFLPFSLSLSFFHTFRLCLVVLLMVFTPHALVVALLSHCLVASVVASQHWGNLNALIVSFTTSLHYSLLTFVPFCHLASLPTSHPFYCLPPFVVLCLTTSLPCALCVSRYYPPSFFCKWDNLEQQALTKER